MGKKKILPRFDLWTIIMSAYLINQFYIDVAVSVQRIILFSLLCMYIFINWGYVRKIVRITNKKNAIYGYVLLFAFWIFGVISTPFTSGSGDFTYVAYCVTFFSWTLYLLAIVVRVEKKYPNRDRLELFMYLFSYCMALHVISTVIILLVPKLREFATSVVYNSEYSRMLLEKEKYYTRIGWSGFSGYSTSLKCTVAACFALYIVARTYLQNKKNSIGIFILYALVMLGNIFYARTGALVSVVCTIIAVFYIAVGMGKIKVFLKYFSILILALIMFILFLNSYTGENVVFNWIFELFLSNDSNKGYSAISLDIMFNQMLFKPELSTILWGDGYYTGENGFSYMRTDLGFMRLILYFGIFFTVFIYSIYIYCLRKITLYGRKQKMGLIALQMFCAFLAFEFKGESIVILMPIAFVVMTILPRYGKEIYNE